MTQHFDFEINLVDSVIDIYLDDISEPLEIDTKEYYRWAKSSGYADYYISYPDTSKNNGKSYDEGYYTYEQFLGLPYDVTKEYLIDFYKKVLLKNK